MSATDPEYVTVQIPHYGLADRFSKNYRGKSWAKNLTRTDPSQKGGYAYNGEWVRSGSRSARPSCSTTTATLAATATRASKPGSCSHASSPTARSASPSSPSTTSRPGPR